MTKPKHFSPRNGGRGGQKNMHAHKMFVRYTSYQIYPSIYQLYIIYKVKTFLRYLIYVLILEEF